MFNFKKEKKGKHVILIQHDKETKEEFKETLQSIIDLKKNTKW